VPWFKGNTHTHTNASDGDAPLDDVADWYQARGYDFLVITDHNRVTDTSRWSGGGGRLLLLPGCEVSLSSEGKPVHINSLGSATPPDLSTAGSITSALQQAIDAIRAAGGVPQVNHPNFKWAFTDEPLRPVRNYSLLEVFNASTDCNNFGGGGWPGVEEIWDRLLSAGRRVWAVASDDAHHLRAEFWGHWSPPGRAWVTVRAPTRSPRAILDAMERGDFYASTEVALEEIRMEGTVITVRMAPDRDYRYAARFIGAGGRTLKVVQGNEAIYHVRGDEGYVRAKVCSSNGGVAWTQPWFLA
jgi:hypothetical protein